MYRTFLLFIICFQSLVAGLSGQALVSYQLKGYVSLPEMTNRYGALMEFDVRQYKITYTTVDLEGRPDTASGLVVLPLLEGGRLPLLCYQHGTSGSRDDVPSNLRGTYEVAEVFAGLGYFSIAPDYLGLGESRGIHPYVHADSEAWAAVDMLFAAREFAAQQGVELNDQLFITGYSQGGHAAAALHREIQENYTADFQVTASAPMSGPYSISGVMRELILSEEAYSYPAYLANTIISYDQVYGLYDDLNAVLKEPYASMTADFREGRITLGTLNSRVIDSLTAQFGIPLTKGMLQDSVLENFSTDPAHPLNTVLEDNDVFDWAPAAPTLLLYCEGDDQVPFRNSIVADSVMNARGAMSVRSFNVGSSLDHVQCAEPAITTGALFFSQFQKLENTPVDEVAVSPVRVFPNPASDLLLVEGAPAGAELVLMDASGRTRIRQLVTADRDELPVRHLPPGIYTLRVIDGETGWVERVVIQPK